LLIISLKEFEKCPKKCSKSSTPNILDWFPSLFEKQSFKFL
jgi:hypothetical protein